MKHVAIILTAFLLYACGIDTAVPEFVTDEEITSDLPPKEAKKKIKIITATTLRSKIFAPDRFDFEKRTIQNFDSLGNLIEMKEFIVDSTILYRHQFQEYHGDTLFKMEKNIGNVYKPKMRIDTSKFLKGRIIEQTTTNIYQTSIDSEGENREVPIPTRLVYEYDNQQRLKSTIQNHNGTIYSCNLTYNSKNQLVTKSCEGDKSSIYPYEERYNYDRKGLKLEQTETSYSDRKAVVEYKRYYQYNSDDSLIFESRYRNGDNFLIANYEFNQKGQRTADFIYDGSGGSPVTLSLKHYYYYDWDGNLKMHVILGNNGDPVRTTLFTYDDENNLIQERRYTHSIDMDKRAVMTRMVTRYRYVFY